MQELVSSETLNNEEEIIVFEENLKGPKGDKGDKGDDGYTPKKGVDYFTENDKQELIEAVTEDASSEFVQIVNSKTTEFNNNATAKTNTFNSNATSKETSYNDNATTKLNEYNENHTIKMNAYNENSAEKLAEFNENAAEKLEEYDEHIEELDNIVSKNTVNGESIYIDDALEYKVFGAKVDGNAKQTTTTGKNYFNAYAINNTAISVENDGQTIAIDVVTSGNGAINTHKTLAELCPNLAVGDQVVLRFNRNLGITHNAFIYLGSPYDEVWVIGNSKTITAEMLNCEVMLYGNRYMDGETEQCIITDFTIMKSSETDTTFEPFTNNEPSPNPDYPQDIEVINGNVKIINCGKNLITKQGFSTPLNEPDYYGANTTYLTPLSDGWGHLECDNSSGSNTMHINFFIKINNIHVKPNTQYTIFSEIRNGSLARSITLNQNVDKDLFKESKGIGTVQANAGGIFKTLVTTKDVLTNDMNLRCYSSVYSGEKSSFDIRMMILEGDWTDKEVEYEQYKSNEHTIDLQDNELVKLTDDIKDTIEIDKNGNVSLNKKIGKAVLDENTNPTIASQNYPNLFFFSLSALGMNVNSLKAISDYFTFVDDTRITDNASANTYLEYGQFAFRHGTVDRIYFKIANITTETDFKAWLSENNVTVYYELAEPTTSSLGQLTNFKTYAGINHFFLETNISTNFEIKYAQDLQKVISKQQVEIDELKTLLSSTATSAMLLDNYANDLMEEV